jgi:glycine cleavage system H protein
MQIAGYEFPEKLYYDANHCWVKKEGELLVLGLDDFGQKLAGEIVYVQVPPEGTKVKKGKTIGKIESGKWLGNILSPVDGELVEINEDLEINPSLINQDCYGQGWIFKIKPAGEEWFSALVHGSKALEKWMKEEIKKYADNL